MIPQNTTFITKEMIEQLEVEQRLIQKELVNYYSWINQSRILLEVMLQPIKKKLKKINRGLKLDQLKISLIFKRWTI